MIYRYLETPLHRMQRGNNASLVVNNDLVEKRDNGRV